MTSALVLAPPVHERIMSLVCGLGPSKRYSRLLLMLNAYFDDSTEAGRYLILAGYMATAPVWADFSTRWERLLTLNPPLEAFKMNLAAQNEERMERAKFHHRIIRDHGLLGIGCAIDVVALKKVATELNIPLRYRNPYYLAWRAVITLSIEAKKMMGLDGAIQFVFDDQSECGPILSGWDAYAKTIPADVADMIRGKPSFMNDRDVVPLQAADLLAWWARKQYGADPRNMRALFPTDWTGDTAPNLLFGEMTEENIRAALEIDIGRRPSRV